MDTGDAKIYFNVAEGHVKIYFGISVGVAAGMLGARAYMSSQSLVVTVEGKEGESFGMMGWIRVMPGWAYYPV